MCVISKGTHAFHACCPPYMPRDETVGQSQRRPRRPRRRRQEILMRIRSQAASICRSEQNVLLGGEGVLWIAS